MLRLYQSNFVFQEATIDIFRIQQNNNNDNNIKFV